MHSTRAKSTPGSRQTNRSSQTFSPNTYPPHTNAQFFQARASRVKSLLDPNSTFNPAELPPTSFEHEHRSVQFEPRDSDPDSDLVFDDFDTSPQTPKLDASRPVYKPARQAKPAHTASQPTKPARPAPKPAPKSAPKTAKPVAKPGETLLSDPQKPMHAAPNRNGFASPLGESNTGDHTPNNSLNKETNPEEPEVIEERQIAETLNKQKERLLQKRNELIKAREMLEMQRKEEIEKQRLLRIEKQRRRELEQQIEREKQRDRQRRVYLTEIRRLQPETQALEKQIELEEQRLEMMKQDTDKLQILDEDISNLVPTGILQSPKKRTASESNESSESKRHFRAASESNESRRHYNRILERAERVDRLPYRRESRLEQTHSERESPQVEKEPQLGPQLGSQLGPQLGSQLGSQSPVQQPQSPQVEPQLEPQLPQPEEPNHDDRDEKTFNLINRMHEYDRAQRALNQPNSPIKQSAYPITLQSPIKHTNPNRSIDASLFHPTVLSTPRKPAKQSEQVSRRPAHNYAVWSEAQWREFSEALKATFDERAMSPSRTADALNSLCKRFPPGMKNMELAEFVARMKVWVRKSENLKR